MLFFLDNDTDVAVCRVIRQRGHECWSAGSVGLAQAPDDTLAVYADEHGAVLVSHDIAFAKRRRDNTIGRHVWLRCDQPDGPDLLAAWFDDALEAVMSMPNVVVRVSRQGVTVYGPRWK